MSTTAIVFRRLRTLGKLRDVLLVAASIVYVSGYAVWALIAWRRQLGTLPVLDAQYFVAGLPPVVSLLVAAGITVGLAKVVLPRWKFWYGARPWWVQLILRTVLSLIPLFALAVAARIARTHPTETGWILGTVGLVFWLSVVLISQVPIATSSLQSALALLGETSTAAVDSALKQPVVANLVKGLQYQDRANNFVMIYVAPLAAAVAFVAVFVGDLYPRIPQELGGGKPRCATLDLESTQLSEEARAELLGATSLGSDQPAVVRSRPLDIYFTTSDVVFVGFTREGVVEQRIDVPRSSIKLVRWCAAP